MKDMIASLIGLLLIGSVPLLKLAQSQTAEHPQPDSAMASSAPQCLLSGAVKKEHEPFSNFPLFPEELSSSFPVDVYLGNAITTERFRELKASACPADRLKIQRYHDIFSWQSFLALQWPVDDQGRLRDQFWLDQRPPAVDVPLRWHRWKDVQEVFHPNGEDPTEWGTARSAMPEFAKVLAQAGGDASAHASSKNDFAHFLLTKKSRSDTVWDQNKNPLYYEVLLNQTAFDFIVRAQLYHRDGQRAYMVSHSTGGVDMRFGASEVDGGPILVKLAWKVMAGNDLRDRFYKLKAYIPEGAGNWKQVEVGLVGIHIMQRTSSAPQWIWSSFEHIDNVRVDPAEVLELAEQSRTLRPSFFNPDCPACPVNTPGVNPTQITRVIPISPATVELNRQVRAFLKEKDSVWRHYELIGTQYPTTLSKPVGPGQAHGSITNHSGGSPAPAFLTNSVLETFDQVGNQSVKDVSGNAHAVSIFQTGSCMGCHYDAKIVTGVDEKGQEVWMPHKADFSFLFERAQRKVGPSDVHPQ